MASGGIDTTGVSAASFEGELREVPKRYRRGIERLHKTLRRQWVKAVQSSTWVSPIPAKEETIVFQAHGDTSFVFGWDNYPGEAAARARFALRMPLLERILAKYFKNPLITLDD